MPIENAILAVTTTPELSRRFDPHVDIVLTNCNFNQKIDSISPLEAENVHLVIDGGHGNSSPDTGEPIELNDLSYQNIKKQVDALKRGGHRFKSIHLTSCCSVAFVPLYRDLLTEDGVIFCNTLSANHHADGLFNPLFSDDKDLFSKWFADFCCRISMLIEMSGNPSGEIFIADAVYTQEYKTLHRFCIKNPQKAFQAHNNLILFNGERPEGKQDLINAERYLQKFGIQVDDTYLQSDQLELDIRKIVFPRPLRRIIYEDLKTLALLDKSIFANESHLSPIDCIHEDYSWVIHSANDPNKILSYVWVTPVNQNELFIHNLATTEGARRLGCAKRMLYEVIKQAKMEQRCVRLRVRTDNVRAMELYKKLGFQFDSIATHQEWQYMRRDVNDFTSIQYQRARNSDDTFGYVREVEIMNPIIEDNYTVLPPNYGFLLKVLTCSASICLLTAATMFFPLLGFAATMGLVGVTAYSVSASCAAISLGGFGFFGYMVHSDNQVILGEDVHKPDLS